MWVGQTNNFGTHWGKPLLILLIFSLIFYCYIIVGISDEITYVIDINRNNLTVTFNILLKHLYTLPQLLNPIHSIKEIFPEYESIGFTVYMLDFVLKVLLAFFIFQIISAFRKFMK